MHDQQTSVETRRPLHKIFQKVTTSPEQGESKPQSFGALALLETAAFLGMLTGLVEVLLLVLQHTFAATSTLGGLQMNRHYQWMIPVTHLLIFVSAGVPMMVLSSFRPLAARRLCLPIFLFLSMFSLLLLAKVLHIGACLILALGIAKLANGWMERHFELARKTTRRCLPGMIAIVAILGGIAYQRHVLAEQITLAALPKTPADTPNVLLLVLDTVRADRLSLAGYGRGTTPNIDRLAQRGVVFKEARSTAPWTLPSHAGMFTGRLPHELKMTGDHPLDASFPTLAEELSKSGYATAGFVGNTYFCNSWYGLGRGFAHYEDYYEDNIIISPNEALRCSALGRLLISTLGSSYNARPGTANALKDAPRVNRDFLNWLPERQGKPFFAFLNYIDAHDPYQARTDHTEHFGLTPESVADFNLIQNWHQHDKKTVTPRDLKLLSDCYDDCLSNLDEHLGKLFEELERQGILKNTLVVITSDHGEAFGEHGLYLHGQSLYRQEVHVPLIVFGPTGIPQGTTVEAPVSLRDLASTIIDRAGLKSGLPGKSLARFWESPSAGATNEEPVISEVAVRAKVSRVPNPIPAMRGPMHSVTSQGMVYIRDALGSEELYDLKNDREQTNDLATAPEHQERLKRMRDLMPAPFPDTRTR